MLSSIVELVIYVAFLLVLAALTVTVISLSHKNKKLNKQLIQITLDRMAILSELGEMSMRQNAKRVEETDGFMRFMSESRDWAFTYIEDVQQALADYSKLIDGLPVPRDISIDKAEEINNAYQRLIDLLPTDK